ncbi:DegT/DnrJ/EryC1/StrS family aminotransferase [Gammaproteobacteria bacterium]|nr:DegT/DnrJ/EryC1/StrS family aminotransferase [Gammaproteobacteria bacterium]
MSVYVTRPYIPKKKSLDKYFDRIYRKKQLTNGGPLVQELAIRLEEHLDTKHVLLLSSGTAAIQIAIKLFSLKNEVVTTPFTFPATSSALVWEGCKPIYGDIDPFSFNLTLNENLFTKNTQAILATHVFGNPCDIEKIESEGKKRGIPVMFDSAHCFAVRVQNESVLNFGDASVLSFHATKIFHSIEGGALILSDENLVEEGRQMSNFGFGQDGNIKTVGINAKMNEFEAAFGLAVMDEIDYVLNSYKERWCAYDAAISPEFRRQSVAETVEPNYSYFPVLCPNEEICSKILRQLEMENIFARRYFYPSLDSVHLYGLNQSCPVSRDVAERILCLPLYHDLRFEEVEIISNIVNKVVESTQI